MGLISNGTTIFDSGSFAAGFGGSMSFIKKLTASSSGTLSFVDGASSVVLDNTYAAGYVNTTTALTRIQFKFSSGNMDSGTIKMYGIK